MKIEIRDMTDEDFFPMVEDCKKALTESTIEARIHPKEIAREKAEEYYAKCLPDGIKTSGHTFKSVFVSGQSNPAGDLWLKRGGDSSYFIMWVHVNPEYRKQGIATAAFEWIDLFAKENKATDIRLHVFASNKEAKSLYSKMGFMETGYSMLKCYDD